MLLFVLCLVHRLGFWLAAQFKLLDSVYSYACSKHKPANQIPSLHAEDALSTNWQAKQISAAVYFSDWV